MKNFVTSERAVFKMDKSAEPAITVKDGSVVKIKTKDYFNGQIQNKQLQYGDLDWKQFSPTTGPIYIEEARSGDLLAVTIEKIELLGTEVFLLNGPNVGITDDLLTSNFTRCYKVRENRIMYSDEIHIPITKTIGLLRTEGLLTSKSPANNDGLLDSSEITEGATIFLPVEKQGASLYIGNVRATAGFGKTTTTSAEAPAEITLRLQTLKNRTAPTPTIIHDNHLICLASDLTIEKAAKKAMQNMITLLTESDKMTTEDAMFLLSLQAEFQVCNMGKSNITTSIKLPLDYFPEMPFL
ncbi:acetamidase/formamidase family protein [Listeria monocytogenes]|uniref:acetamidase/formamidase family protein n=1 Tax=Listeria monocytogenes TaxID=1639 RepID=UPI000E6B5195|nr:acetamidase/formamidase family protein [Listeria monocytogenes]EGP8870975.1 acetamidase/formamidase family protein [Listeria monocytogenes]EGS4844504.1 acetamidase/formamidase family protein [Listeria monocytogenes]EGT1699317.1 acetamidase/formamidase family protein [Listeria monocytogenes]EHL2499110.1 acetamidase/formamidase family protein [Listeria monocytogenes]EHL2543328.1 acetamidase/formamidase family protein [Listeria monocytogenes]